MIRDAGRGPVLGVGAGGVRVGGGLGGMHASAASRSSSINGCGVLDEARASYSSVCALIVVERLRYVGMLIRCVLPAGQRRPGADNCPRTSITRGTILANPRAPTNSCPMLRRERKYYGPRPGAGVGIEDGRGYVQQCRQPATGSQRKWGTPKENYRKRAAARCWEPSLTPGSS